MPINEEALRITRATREKVGYIDRKLASSDLYHSLGFKCGLEIHQQLKTAKKLFCRCPAGIYHEFDDYHAEIIRHMRPTLSELGEYDGTALMEFKTRKEIVYRINNKTACTYEIDDTPPFKLNQEALDITLRIAHLLKCNIVGELHITRKQYLDGSIPTGFQRTGIVGIEGEIPLTAKRIRIIQLSLEEDSCREVSDIRHRRVYSTDRLGMPLIEMVTYPDMTSPEEAAEAGNYLRFLVRSTGLVRTGIGAAREDVNVSINDGCRVEIKGVAHIKWIPELTHNEAFRQKSLLLIREELKRREKDPRKWKISRFDLTNEVEFPVDSFTEEKTKNEFRFIALNLPKFAGILPYFTQPGKTFADELTDRLKVIACIEKPNMTHSMAENPLFGEDFFQRVKQRLKSRQDDAQVILWGPAEDIDTAVETVQERCQLAFAGVLNETRKALPDGTTMFERVLPGPDRMYPDTDSAPIAIDDGRIERQRKNLPPPVAELIQQMITWKIPRDTYQFILGNNLFHLIERIVKECQVDPVLAGTVIGQRLKNLSRKYPKRRNFPLSRIFELFQFVVRENFPHDLVKYLLPEVYQHPRKAFGSILRDMGYRRQSPEKIYSTIPSLIHKFSQTGINQNERARHLWIMGQLEGKALGNVKFKDLSIKVGGGNHG